MRNLWLALCLICLGIAPAQAQNFTMPPPAGVTVGGFVVVTSCGSQTLSVGKPAFATMDTTGTLCTAGGGGGGGGLSVTDRTAWTQGTSAFTPTGGVYNDSATLTTGTEGTARLNANREMHIDCDVTNVLCALINSPGYMAPYPGSGSPPVAATPITASAAGTTAATTATLAGVSGKTTYICTLSVRSNATTASEGHVTSTGLTTNLAIAHWTAAVASGIGTLEKVYTPCVPASATNTAIAITAPAAGTGGDETVNLTGFQL